MKHIFLTILFFGTCVYSQPLTWDDVLSEAKIKNTALKKSVETINQTKLQYRRTKTNFFPQFSAGAGTSVSDSEYSKPSNQYSYNVSGSLSLYSGLSDVNKLKIKDIELKIVEERYRRTLADMVYNLKKSFIDLLYAQELVSLTEKILQRRIQNYELLKFKYESGREDKGSLLRVEADKLQAEYDFEKSKRNLTTASAQLAKDIGRDSFDIITVTGSFIVPSVDKNINIYHQVEKIPEVIISNLILQKNVLEIEVTKGNYRPEISMSGSLSLGDNKIIPESNKWNSSLSLRLSYPLYTAGRNVYDLKIANSNWQTAELDFKDTKLQVTVKLQSALNSFIDSTENLKVRKKYFEASEEQSNITSTKYINGLVSYNDWYSIEENYINAQKSLLNAKKEVKIAEIYLKNVLGVSE